MHKSTLLLGAAVLATGLTVGFATRPADKAYAPRPHSFLPEEEENEEAREAENARGMIDYMAALRANPATGEVNPADVQRAIDQANRMANQRGSLPLQWQELGPDNIGGRTRAILVDNRDNNVVYAGGVSGGLWKSVTKGQSWFKITDMQDVSIISAIGQTPNGDIFVGTGEAEFARGSNGSGNSGFTGRGLFLSTNGTNFTLINNTKPASANATWANVTSIGSDPVKNRIYVGNSGGLYYSEDKGATAWKKVTGIGTGAVQEVKVDKNGVVYAATATAMWKATDGITYSRIGNGVIIGGSRLAIAVSESDPNFVYAQGASASTNRLTGVFQSTDAGATWTVIAKQAMNNFDFNPLNNQGDYDNVIAVDPTDPGRIFSGGLDWWEWKDPNSHAANVSGWTKTAVAGGVGFIGNNLYIHADKHAIVFDTKNTPYTTYIGTDGGISRSFDMCKTFVTSNKGYNVTQFYGMDVSLRNYLIGGTQDNNSLMIKGNGNTKMSAFSVLGGDGFQARASRVFPDVLFYESQYGNLHRTGNSGQSNSSIFDCEMVWFVDSRYGNHSGAAGKCEDKNDNFNGIFDTPIALRENKNDSSSRFLTMMHRQNGTGTTLWITREATDVSIQGSPKWYRVSEVATGSGMGRIELSYDWNWAWYSAGGSLFRVRGLETGVYDTMLRHPWNGNFIPLNPGDPVQNGMITDAIPNPSGGQVITSIKQDPKDPNHLLLTVGNYGANAYIFETNNALDTVNPVTWTSIHGNLPDMPVYDVAMLPEKPQVLIAGTELGVYVSENGGATWTENNSGMCRVPVFQVRVYQNNTWSGPEVYIGTHGRGMFKATNLLTGIARQNTEPATDLRVYPNPAADQSLLQFTLGKASAVTIRVADLSGKTVFTGSYQLAGGQHQLPLQVATWPAGNYIVTLQSNQSRQCRKLLVTH